MKTTVQSKSNQARKSESTKTEYIARINRVIDYIEKNVDEDLSLEILAGVACFSSFHFHRIFKAIIGETLNQFINRIRVEKSAAQLMSNPNKTITDIAFDCGFSGSASFARSFKQYFKMSASQWRSQMLSTESKNCIIDSKNCIIDSKNRNAVGKNSKDIIQSSNYIDTVTNNLTWRIKMQGQKQLNIEIKEMPDFPVVYVRNVGPYKGDSNLFEDLFNRLMIWAGPRGLFLPDAKMMAVYHDDPKVTEEEKLRVSACLTVDKKTQVDGEIGKMVIDGGQFAVASFELAGSDEYEEAWNMVFGEWLPQSGYQPDDRLCYEIYHNDPKEHPKGHHIVDICIPVKPL